MRATASRTRASSASRRRRKRPILRHLHGLQRTGDPPSAHRDGRLPALPHTHAGRRRREEQRHGLFPRRVDGRLRDARAAQDDENLFIMFSDNPHYWSDPQLLLRPRRDLGIGEGRQLRLAHRDRRWLAGDHPWGRAPCASTASGRCCWILTTHASHRPPARAFAGAGRHRAGRLCAQCSLQLRLHAPWPRAHPPLRYER